MRAFLIKCFLVLNALYPLKSLAEVQSALPVFKRDSLLIISQPPKPEPNSSFITVRELDAYYGQLLMALKRRQPEADARYFVNQGQRYLLQTNAKMTGEQQSKYYPAELSDNAIYNAINRVCPWAYSRRSVEGETDSSYINVPRLTKIHNKQELAPKGETLLPVSLIPTASYPTKMYKLYQQVLADYVSRWNSVMYVECKRLGGAPDINKIAPVKVTHKLMGNTVFILNELPFTEPRPKTQSDSERAIYGIRLARAMRQKNVEADVQTSIHQQQTYFLGMKSVAVGDWFGRGPRPKNFKPRYISYHIEEGDIDPEEAKKLARVCPIRMLESRDVVGSGQIGTVDFTNYPNAQYQPHEAEMRQFFKSIRNYEKRWNQTMLPICREKLKKQK